MHIFEHENLNYTHPTPMSDSIIDDVKDMIEPLRNNGCEKLANILEHRLYRIAWTTVTELHEELKHVFNEANVPDNLELKIDIQNIRKRLHTLS